MDGREVFASSTREWPLSLSSTPIIAADLPDLDLEKLKWLRIK